MSDFEPLKATDGLPVIRNMMSNTSTKCTHKKLSAKIPIDRGINCFMSVELSCTLSIPQLIKRKTEH